MIPQRFQRRQFLQIASGLGADAFGGMLTRADDLAKNSIGETEAVVLSKNEIRETRGRASRIGILIGAETRDIRSEDNRIEGMATSVSDLRKK